MVRFFDDVARKGDTSPFDVLAEGAESFKHFLPSLEF
jgi:hypothetical protein